MYLLTDALAGHEKIKNIIFDFGGVICDIDIHKTIEKFNGFGPGRDDPARDPGESFKAFEELVAKYETGLISSSVFRENIRDHYLSRPGDQAIDDAWNALLLGIPEKRIRLLENIKHPYKLILLSNTNEIHYQFYLADFRNKYGYTGFEGIFEKVYFSFRLHVRKPDPAIFRIVLSDMNLNPYETLFIDDMLQNVEAAISTGITGYHLKEGEDVTDLFVSLEYC